jgi:CheY-like chemotaxis protein
MAKRIITVDDAATLRRLVGYTFRGVGQDVTEAEDGEDAPIPDQSIDTPCIGDSQMKQTTADMQSQPLTATNTSISADVDVLRRAFEGLGASAFLPDRHLNLIYMNGRARTVLLEMEAERKASLQLGADEWIGQSLDVFHGSHAARIRSILNDVRNVPIRSSINIGIRTRQMVENAPINIMLANTDLVIDFMNKGRINTLRQRQLPAHPKNLPYHAKFRPGNETLSLLVRAGVANEVKELAKETATTNEISRSFSGFASAAPNTSSGASELQQSVAMQTKVSNERDELVAKFSE